MVLDYYPMNIKRTYELIWEKCDRDDINVEEIIYDLIDDRFCKYIFKTGSNKGKMCISKFSKNIENNILFLCRKHRYQEKHKCCEDGCNKLIKYNKYCKKHNIPKYKKHFYYNNYNEKYVFLKIDLKYLYKNIKPGLKHIILLTAMQPYIIDLEKDISFYILKIDEENENKIVDTETSNFLKSDKNNILKYINNLYLLIKNEKYFDEIKSFMLNIINILEMEKNKINIKDYISNIINKQLNPSIIYDILDKQKRDRLNSNLDNMVDSEKRKKKKRLQKFNKKYNKLIELNDKTIKKYKSNFYINYINKIINSNIECLNKKINKYGQNIDFIRNTYSNIYNELLQLGWEVNDKLNKKDYEIINNINSWKEYAIHEDEEYKSTMKI